MRLGQTSAIFFISKFLGSIIGFAASVVLARILGEAVLGQYATVLALVAWLTIAGKVGLSESITKRLSEGEEVAEYVGAGLLATSGIGILVLGVTVFLRDWVNAYVGTPVTFLLIIMVLTSLLNSFGSAAIQGRHLVHISSILSTLAQLIRSSVQITLLFAGAGLQAMLAAYALSRAIPGFISFKYIGVRPAFPSRRHFTSLFDFAKFSWLGNVQSRVFNTLDILLLKLFVASGFVGIYSAAWSIGMVLDLFGDAIRAAMFPEMSKVSSSHDDSSVATLTENALTYTGLLLIPGFVGGLIVGDRLLRIYGEGFVIGTEVLAILLFALLIYTYTKQLLNTLNAVNRPDLAFRTNAVFIGSNIVLNLVLIYLYEWVGAAVATLLSGIVGIVVSARYVNQLIDVQTPVGEIGRQWVAAIAMGSIVYAVRAFTEGHPLTSFNAAYVTCLVSLGAAVYFGLLLAISSQFRMTIVDNLPVEI
ncbi:oligosaccharide flippase family protein [Haloarchaeobius amylolyticus]|uniref:oligosaccharide flippase family protein n=1 Tax=Haloarchaeobius amylolyticus TaxID=1198296 RepID=UPI002270584F|nr:oligosaccharide flippase family protein [Haloarchaeobius amylolyticus]